MEVLGAPGLSADLSVWGWGRGRGNRSRLHAGLLFLLCENPLGLASLPCGCRRDARVRGRPGNSSGDGACPRPHPCSSSKGKGCDGTPALCLRLLLNLCSFGRLKLSAWFIKASAWTVSRTKQKFLGRMVLYSSWYYTNRDQR